MENYAKSTHGATKESLREILDDMDRLLSAEYKAAVMVRRGILRKMMEDVLRVQAGAHKISADKHLQLMERMMQQLKQL